MLPSVAPDALAETFDTVMSHSPAPPCVNVPVLFFAMARMGAGLMVIVSLAKVPAVMPAPLNVNPLTVADAPALADTFTGKLKRV